MNTRSGEHILASSFDLAPRLAALQAAGYVVASDYRGDPPKWLTTALQDVDLHIVNCKGVKVDDTPVLLKLATLEELVGTKNAIDNRRNHGTIQDGRIE